MSFTEYPYRNFSDLNLDWIIKNFNDFISSISELKEWRNTHEAEYQELKRLHDRILAGDFPESIKNAFADWMRFNAAPLVGEMVKNVFFGLTDSGYFVAYIPDSWADIIFNTTGLDIEVSDVPYGHLVLSY